MTGYLTLRPAREADAELLLGWRNDPGTRAASRNRNEVAPQEHSDWLGGVLDDPTRSLLIAESESLPVGQVRFDGLGGAEVEISVSVDPAQRARGLGTALIAAGAGWLAERHPGVAIIAEIRPENEASLRAFARVGFTPVAQTGAMVRLQLRADPSSSD